MGKVKVMFLELSLRLLLTIKRNSSRRLKNRVWRSIQRIRLEIEIEVMHTEAVFTARVWDHLAQHCTTEPSTMRRSSV